MVNVGLIDPRIIDYMANDYNDLEVKKYHFMTLSMRFVTTNVPLLLKKTTLIDYKDQYIRDMTIHDSSFDLDTFQRHHHIIVCLCKKIVQKLPHRNLLLLTTQYR